MEIAWIFIGNSMEIQKWNMQRYSDYNFIVYLTIVIQS
jgi:hypothetical protein